MRSILNLSDLGTVVPHPANVSIIGGGGLRPLGGGSGGGIPAGVPSGYTTPPGPGSSYGLPPAGRTSIVFKKKQAVSFFRPTMQGSRIMPKAGELVYTHLRGGPAFTDEGLFGLSGRSVIREAYQPSGDFLSGLDGFFSDIFAGRIAKAFTPGRQVKKIIRYTGAAVVAPFAPASATRKIFGLSPRESSQFETGAKVARGVLLAAAGTTAIVYGAKAWMAGAAYGKGAAFGAQAATGIGAGGEAAAGVAVGVSPIVLPFQMGVTAHAAAAPLTVGSEALLAPAVSPITIAGAAGPAAFPAAPIGYAGSDILLTPTAPSLIPTISQAPTNILTPTGLTAGAFPSSVSQIAAAQSAALPGLAPGVTKEILTAEIGAAKPGLIARLWAGTYEAGAAVAKTTLATGSAMLIAKALTPLASGGEPGQPSTTYTEAGQPMPQPTLMPSTSGGGGGEAPPEAPPFEMAGLSLPQIVIGGGLLTTVIVLAIKKKKRS